jgi:hypothetical protein
VVSPLDFVHHKKGFTACFGDPDRQAFDFRVLHQDVGFAFRARQVVQRGLGKIDFHGHNWCLIS